MTKPPENDMTDDEFERAADEAYAYIRNAALATSETIDLDGAREALLVTHHMLKEAMAALSGRAGAA